MDQLQSSTDISLAELRSARGTDLPDLLRRFSAVVAAGDRAIIIAGCTLLAPQFHPGDYVAAAMHLCDLTEFGLAERVVLTGRSLFPKDLALMVEQARIPERAGDPLRALPLFQAVRDLAPYEPASYLGETQCLRDLGRLEAAASLIQDAAERFLHDLPIAVTKAELAEQRGRPDDALAAWAAVRERFTHWSAGYTRAARLLRDLGRFADADAMLEAAIVRFPEEAGPRMEYAWCAQIGGNWAQARARWHDIRARYPNDSDGWVNGARVEWNDGQLDVAQALLHEAVARFSHKVDVATEWAFLAVRLGQAQAAEQRWLAVCDRFPNYPSGYAEGIKALAELGRLEAAQQLAEQAATKFPEDPRVQAAIVGVARLRADQAHMVLAAKRAEGSAQPEDHAAVLRALIAAGAYSEVQTEAAQAQASFPDHLELHVLEAEAAERAGSAATAEAVWHRIQQRFPDYPAAYSRRSTLLATAGDLAAAEAVLAAACAQFPDQPWAFHDHAALAESRQDWAEAVRRWSLVERRFGERHGERLHVLRVRMLDQEVELAQQGGDLSGLLNARRDEIADAADDDDSRIVMMTIESLGGITTGCEFGAVQRAFGAEPLGLLRWSGMSLNTLIDILERRFRDIGDPATTEVGTFDHGARKEYSILDKTFGFHLHSHVFDDEVDESRFFAQMTKRMKFLTLKMVSDLAIGEKLLLFKHSIREPSEEEVDRLSRALASYGPNICLLVGAADADHPSGTIRDLRDNIWLGYLDFSGGYDEARVGKWLQLCRAAYQKFRPPSG